jgi:hypothetical protein
MSRSGPEAERPAGRGFYVFLGAVALLLSSFPYLYGYLKTPPGHVYTGLTSNIDDCMVYLSWMNEYASGRFTHRNLFSTEQSPALLFYAWFGILGILGKLFGTAFAFHLGRVLGGAGLLWAARWLIQLTLSKQRARKLAFALLCFASGLGWVFGGFDPAKGFYQQPIDTFSPEAITFLSLGYSPLFAPMTALMVVFVASFLNAERTGRRKDLWPACVAGAVLGNSHTYDVVPLLLATGAWAVLNRPGRAAWLRLGLVASCTLPTALYNLVASRIDPLFKARIWANEPTLTAPLWWVALGLGLPLAFALVALARRGKGDFVDLPAFRLLACWLAAHLLCAYLPVPVQRKLLMGIHVPLCLLAGAGLSSLLGGLSKDMGRLLGPLALLLCVPGNVLSLLTDSGRLDANAGTTAARPYLTLAEKEALEWLKANATEGATLVGPDPASVKRYPGHFAPSLAPQVAGIAGRVVYNGHWSETFDYRRKFPTSLRFFSDQMTDKLRRSLCQDTGIRYILYPGALTDSPPEGFVSVLWSAESHPDWLEVAHKNAEITLFRVVSP